jgi:glycosyltransferase involved in cell wall biosynthesis
MSSHVKVNITIPTYNRARSMSKAIRSALGQAYDPYTVTVIDDGSQDDTWRRLQGYASEPNFSAIRLRTNVGTAQAKNVALIFSDYEAITFHDSDDIAHEDKVLLQARALGCQQITAAEILNWDALDQAPGAVRYPDIVVGAHELIRMDGTRWRISKRISLVDDFFPNLQFPSKTAGDWCLINAGLFRKAVFAELGGFMDSLEEDRELRNRTIAAGCLYYFIESPLLTKIEMSDSLTIHENTGLEAARRLNDRRSLWSRNSAYRKGLRGRDVVEAMRTPIHLPDDLIEDFINPHLLTVNADLPVADSTLAQVSGYGVTRAYG